MQARLNPATSDGRHIPNPRQPAPDAGAHPPYAEGWRGSKALRGLRFAARGLFEVGCLGCGASSIRARSRRAFTLIEVLVVAGIIALLATLLFPVMRAQFEGAKIEKMKAQLGIIEAGLAAYKSEFGDFPPSWGTGDNAGAEMLLSFLLTTEGGGPFIVRNRIEDSLADLDGDGRQELVDPWRTPWIYFHHADYRTALEDEAVYYTIDDARRQVIPAKVRGEFRNAGAYQLWACGPNRANDAGQGDDVGNVNE
jgi:prepilin-type N-terminal cleavage/methylation domain-containing protein